MRKVDGPKKSKRAISTPDVPILIQLGNQDPSAKIWIHQSRLNKISQWFKRTATHTEMIELDNVTRDALYTFYNWVYRGKDGLKVEGLAEEMQEADSDDEDSDEIMDEPEKEGNVATGKYKRMVAELSIDLVNFHRIEKEDEDDCSKSDVSYDNEDLPWYLTSSLNTRGQIFGRLSDLYAFSITYEVPKLKLAVMLAWQRFSYSTSTFPCPTVVANMIERMPLSSSLVQFVIGCYAHYVDIRDYQNEPRWKALSAEFVTEILVLAQAKCGDMFEADSVEPNDRWCDYHDHDTEESKEDCQNSEEREDDPDIRPRPARRYGGCC